MGGSGLYHPPVKEWTGISSWSAHTNRGTPSTEPGVDWYCPRGSKLYAAAAGRVVDTGDSIGPATGRFIAIDLADGHRVRYLHLESRLVGVGDWVEWGQHIGYTGATGYGDKDWSWNVGETGGAHVHETIFPSHRYVFGRYATLDPWPLTLTSGLASLDAEPIKKPKPYPSQETEMPTIVSSSIGQSLVIGALMVPFTHPDQVVKALTQPSTTVFECAPEVHNALSAAASELGDDNERPTMFIVYGDPSGTIYTFAGGKLEPIYDPATIGTLKNIGVPVVEWSADEIARRNAAA